MKHIESRLSKTDKEKYEFLVVCATNKNENLENAIKELKSKSEYLHILTETGNDETSLKN